MSMQIFGTTKQVAIEFQAAAASDAVIQTLSMCLGNGVYSGTLTVALWSTQTSGSYLPSAIIGSSTLTNSISVSTAYAWVTMTLILVRRNGAPSWTRLTAPDHEVAGEGGAAAS